MITYIKSSKIILLMAVALLLNGCSQNDAAIWSALANRQYEQDDRSSSLVFIVKDGVRYLVQGDTSEFSTLFTSDFNYHRLGKLERLATKGNAFTMTFNVSHRYQLELTGKRASDEGVGVAYPAGALTISGNIPTKDNPKIDNLTMSCSEIKNGIFLSNKPGRLTFALKNDPPNITRWEKLLDYQLPLELRDSRQKLTLIGAWDYGKNDDRMYEQMVFASSGEMTVNSRFNGRRQTVRGTWREISRTESEARFEYRYTWVGNTVNEVRGNLIITAYCPHMMAEYGDGEDPLTTESALSWRRRQLRAAGSPPDSSTAEPKATPEEFLEHYLKTQKYNVVRLIRTRVPMGFPEEKEMLYFEANGAYAGKRPETLQVAVLPSGGSYRVIKIRRL
jgi:hypothetical protein